MHPAGARDTCALTAAGGVDCWGWGFFGQLGFQTSNFLGRGETVGVTAQQGSQAKDYELNFTEPAAQKLHTSQPGISKQIKLLEDEAGLPLFEKIA